jgi:hypothetical protein
MCGSQGRWPTGRFAETWAGFASGVRMGGEGRMFVFYSNKLGCLGSIILSILLTGILIFALRGCVG